MEASRRMIPTLEEISTLAGLEKLRRNFSRIPASTAKDELSQTLLNQLHTPNVAIPPDVCEEIRKNFTFSKVTLGRNNMDENHRAMVYSQNLDTLMLLKLSKEATLYNKNGPTFKDRPYRVNVTGVLKRFLNEESRGKMRNLGIHGKQLSFPAGWVNEVQLLLPAIINLDVTGCHITNQEFTALCQSQLQLVSLSLANTDVQSVKGIGKLFRLKALSLENLVFSEVEDLADVLLLKLLEALYLGSETEHGKTVETFVKCTGSLQMLKILDCSGNEVDINILKKLYNQHPRLSQISLIKTSFERDKTLEISRGITYTMIDFAACIESMKFYKSHPYWAPPILTRIFGYLFSEKYENEENVRKCVPVLIAVLQNYNHSKRSKRIVICCLEEIAKKDSINMLTVAEKASIVKAICSAIKATDWKLLDSNEVYGAHVGMETLVRTNILLGTNLQETVGHLILELLRKITPLVPDLVSTCCFFLINHIEITTAFLNNADETDVKAIKTTIVSNFPIGWRIDEANCAVYLPLLNILNSIKTGGFQKNKDIITFLFVILNAFKYHESIPQNTFECLQLFLPRLKQKHRFSVFNAANFSIIVKYLEERNDAKISLPLKFLLEEHKSITERKEYQPYSQAEMEELLQEILLHKAEYADGWRHVRAFFVHIESRTRDVRIKKWAEWMYSKLDKYYNIGRRAEP